VPKQLTIRSDEAHERANRLARARGLTVTAVVEQALRALEDGAPPEASWVARLSPADRWRYDELKRLADDVVRLKLDGTGRAEP
jgi:predicted transcriptional regulator